MGDIKISQEKEIEEEKKRASNFENGPCAWSTRNGTFADDTRGRSSSPKQ
jgi:hypothetical protein